MRRHRTGIERKAASVSAADGGVPTGMLRVATSMAVPALLQENGVDPAPVLRRFGLAPIDFAEPDNTIPYATLGRLLGRCAELTRCPHFALLVGQRAGISSLGAVGFLMQSSPDVRTAMGSAVRHLWAHNPNTTVQLVVDGSFASLSYGILEPGIEHHDQLLDMAIAIELNIMRALCGHEWRPTEVRFAHVRPRNTAPFRKLFAAPLVFDAGETALVFSSAWLDKTLSGADPLLHAMMQHLVDEFQRQAGEDLASQLRRMLPTLVSARGASIDVAAKRLGFAVRTLTRQLSREGTSFLKLREEVRYAMARQLLQGTNMPANQIADRLGYANASGFTRAFRHWSSLAPVAWRAQAGRGTHRISTARIRH
jgi:AraC-like DNA-binding protein